MDTTLIINPGSASKKYALYREGKEIFTVHFEKTEEGFGKCVQIGTTRQQCETVEATGYENTLHDTVALAIQEGIIQSKDAITRFGIRIVAPGTFFNTHRIVDQRYVMKLKEAALVAPLHVPHALIELLHAEELFPHARIVGISDSAFHSTLPPEARWYSISKKEAQSGDVYRFGYHGLSVASIVRKVHEETKRIPEHMVVCHIGSGVSVTALKKGTSVDTTMGFAPTSGLMMGTRAGDVDTSALLHLFAQPENDREKIERMVTQEGGLKGILGNGDLRVALARSARGEKDAEIAVGMYIQGIRKAIGAMAATLGGIDTVILTGTAAERNSFVRSLVTKDFSYLGMHIDEDRNDLVVGKGGIISTDTSRVEVRVMQTNEMLEMAHIASVF